MYTFQIYIYAYLYIYIYIHIHIYTCICMYMYIYIYIHITKHIYIHTCGMNVYICKRVYLYIYLYIHLYMYEPPARFSWRIPWEETPTFIYFSKCKVLRFCSVNCHKRGLSRAMWIKVIECQRQNFFVKFTHCGCQNWFLFRSFFLETRG